MTYHVPKVRNYLSMPIVTKICSFVNNEEKPDWWRYILSKTIELGELSIVDFEKAYQISKMQYGLEEKSTEYLSLVRPVKATGYHEEEHEYKLISIGNTANISTLATDQKIEFSTIGLTVVYGNNGAGKSSYTKILKNACLTRGEVPELRHNVFTEKAGIPSADILIESNGKSELITWNNQLTPDSRLKSVRVFDSNSSIHYLSKSDILDFKPIALKLLDKLIDACSFISNKAKSDELAYCSSFILPQMHQGTLPSKLKINSKLTNEQIDLLSMTPDELAELNKLRILVVELTNNSPEMLKAKYIKRRARLTPLQKFLTNLVEKLNSESIVHIKSSYEIKERTKLAAEQLSTSTFSELPISQIGSEQWLTMWNAVKNFIENAENAKSFPPQEGDHCPTCLQELDNISALRLAAFDRYLQNEFQRGAAIALKNWNNEVLNIRALSFSSEPYIAILNEIAEKDRELGALFTTLIKRMKEKAEKILLDIPVFDLEELNIDALLRLNKHINMLEEREKNVLNDKTKDTAIINKKIRIMEIEDKEKILNVRDMIKDEVQKCKKREAYSNIKRSALTTSITILNNEICTTSTLGRIQEIFNQELNKLGFDHFKIDTLVKGIKGNQNFSIQLSGNKINILDIASEGEQKCISLASFFAELATDSRKSAIIFDDPVNSLDHIWRLKFAKRISEEAKTRQVIIFTHDIPFLKMIQETSKEASVSLTIKAVTRNKVTTGISLNSPPWDTLSTDRRIKQLKVSLVDARKLTKISHEEYLSSAGSIYGRKRETWERLVEELLLKGTVERFSRAIQTQKLRYLIDIAELDIEIINAAMTKCSTYMIGHDMAEEVSGSFPDIDELEQDVKSLEQYFEQLKKRRK